VTEIANVEQAAAWDGPEGAHWTEFADQYDASLREYASPLLRVADIGADESVLDIGCGTGASTRSAARSASRGHVVGIDLSAEMLAKARSDAAAQGLANVTFVQGDAQVYPFDDAVFDVSISRFGVMFFGDPVAAFTNVGRGLRAGGRLAWLVWRTLAENEWFSEIRRAVAVGRDLPTPPPGAPGPFGLSDPDHTRELLHGAGFTDVAFERCDASYHAGTHADQAFRFVSTLGFTRMMISELSDTDRARALDTLRATIDEHTTADGVIYDSACWLVTAIRRAA
jgi:SAM-dependent methyltransferase